MQHKDQDYISLKEMGKFIDKSVSLPPLFALASFLHKRVGANTAMHALSKSSPIFKPKVLLLCMAFSGPRLGCKKEAVIAAKRLQDAITKLYGYENFNVRLTLSRSIPSHVCCKPSHVSFFVSFFNVSTDNNREKFLLVSKQFEDLVPREYGNGMIYMLHVDQLVTREWLTTTVIPIEQLVPLITKLELQNTHKEQQLSGPSSGRDEIMMQ